ncbi:MAG TPA: SPW repeat protein [Xanthobacteraceae bacterium]|nr:SPW repeat protein [Xanthobacteraceae bacterium]
MRILSTRIHGMMDYAMGVLLILSPYLFGFATGGIKQWLPMALGAAMIGLALLTRYELGAVGAIPMPTHLLIDVLSGLLLAASPWLFGFASIVFWPHLILGLIEAGTACMTQTTPTEERGWRRHPVQR